MDETPFFPTLKFAGGRRKSSTSRTQRDKSPSGENEVLRRVMSLSNPHISIITPVYNGEATLQECFQSVVSQDFEDFEWILVDDRSSDQSVCLIESWRHPKVRLIKREKNAGYPALPRKEGISVSQGELVALLDQDDLWVPHKLSYQSDYLSRNPGIGLLGGNQIMVGPKKHKKIGRKISKQRSFFPTADDVYSKNPFLASTAIFRRSVYDRVGGFDTNPVLNGRDEWELWIRIALESTTRYDDQVMGYYRWHETNLSHQISAFDGTDHVRAKLGDRFSKNVHDAAVARNHFQKAKNALQAENLTLFQDELEKAVALKGSYRVKGAIQKLKYFFKPAGRG